MQQSHESASSGPNHGLLSLYLANPTNGYMEGAQRHRITDRTVLSLIAAITERDAAISEKNTALAEKKAAISERDTVVIQRDVAIAEKEAALLERDHALSARDHALSALKAVLADRESCATCNTGGIPSVPDIIEGQKLLQLRVNGRITEGSPSSSAPSSFNLTENIGKGNKAKRSRKNKNFSASTHKIEGTAVKKQKMQQQTDQQNGSASKVLNVIAIQERKSSQRLGSSLYHTTGFPIPYCSCTGINQQCYRWGNGGWQSACCTNQTSMYPLPMNPNKKGCRVAGRKMSAGAFERLLERLASDGVDISCPVDLKTYWAKHGTNRYVTIK